MKERWRIAWNENGVKEWTWRRTQEEALAFAGELEQLGYTVEVIKLAARP